MLVNKVKELNRGGFYCHHHIVHVPEKSQLFSCFEMKSASPYQFYMYTTCSEKNYFMTWPGHPFLEMHLHLFNILQNQTLYM